MLTRHLPALALALLAGCSRPAATDTDEQAAEQRAKAQAIAAERGAEERLTGDVRVATLQKRVADLEQRLDELQASRAQLDSDVIGQRLAALEVRLAQLEGARGADALPAAGKAAPKPPVPPAATTPRPPAN